MYIYEIGYLVMAPLVLIAYQVVICPAYLQCKQHSIIYQNVRSNSTVLVLLYGMYSMYNRYSMYSTYSMYSMYNICSMYSMYSCT